MQKLKELFFGASGLLAFVADLIAVYSYFFLNASVEYPKLNVIIFLLSLYAWIALSWHYVRQGFLNGAAKNRYQRRLPVIRHALLGVGIPISLINAALSYQSKQPFIFIHLALFPFAYAMLYYLFPIVYEDMRVYITRVGVYVAKHNTWTLPNKEYGDTFLILSGEKITVISDYRLNGEIIPKHYYLKCAHQKGILKYDDLLSMFKVSRASLQQNRSHS